MIIVYFIIYIFDLNENNDIHQILFEEIPSDDNSPTSCDDSDIYIYRFSGVFRSGLLGPRPWGPQVKSN